MKISKIYSSSVLLLLMCVFHPSGSFADKIGGGGEGIIGPQFYKLMMNADRATQGKYHLIQTLMNPKAVQIEPVVAILNSNNRPTTLVAKNIIRDSWRITQVNQKIWPKLRPEEQTFYALHATLVHAGLEQENTIGLSGYILGQVDPKFADVESLTSNQLRNYPIGLWALGSLAKSFYKAILVADRLTGSKYDLQRFLMEPKPIQVKATVAPIIIAPGIEVDALSRIEDGYRVTIFNLKKIAEYSESQWLSLFIHEALVQGGAEPSLSYGLSALIAAELSEKKFEFWGNFYGYAGGRTINFQGKYINLIGELEADYSITLRHVIGLKYERANGGYPVIMPSNFVFADEICKQLNLGSLIKLETQPMDDAQGFFDITNGNSGNGTDAPAGYVTVKSINCASNMN